MSTLLFTTLVWCWLFLCLGYSRIAESYLNYPQYSLLRYKAVWVVWITALMIALTPLILIQHLICVLAYLVKKPPKHSKWTFVRLHFLAYRTVVIHGDREAIYFYPNGELYASK